MDRVEALADALEVSRDLSLLRRGYGLHSPELVSRIGPALAAVCGISDETPPADVRSLLLARVSAAMATLPPDLRLAVQAVFSLPPASQSRFLRERMEWLGTQLQRDPRTAARRVEAGLRLLAEELVRSARAEVVGVEEEPDGDLHLEQVGEAKHHDYAPRGWYVDEMRASLLLHLTPVRLLETRRVVATQDGLDALRVSWSIPSTPGESEDPDEGIAVEILYGGDLVKDRSASTRTYWTGWIRPPRPLDRGDQHEYQVQVFALPRHLLRPYYVLSPHRRVDRFELRAKFPVDAVPERIWQVDGVPFRLVDERHRTGDDLPANGVGEVVSSFRHLRAGLSYGLAWTDPRSRVVG